MPGKPVSLEHVDKEFSARGIKDGERDAAFVALRDVNLEIRSGELFVLVGPSGCGKSTLLDLFAGLTIPTRGRVLVDGQPVIGPGLDRGYVFQQYALLPWRTALANVQLGLEASGMPKTDRLTRGIEILELVGLSASRDKYPHELSGGMKQRVAIGRSLAYDPDVLLMDEPFAAVDALTRDSLQWHLLRIWEETKKTIVFITHSIDEAVFLGQRVGVMTSNPGHIKQTVDIAMDSRMETDDIRSTADFRDYRHNIWELLKDEIARAQRDPSRDDRSQPSDER